MHCYHLVTTDVYDGHIKLKEEALYEKNTQKKYNSTVFIVINDNHYDE